MGDASYSLRVNGLVAEDAVWAYPEPKPAAQWLRGYRTLDWEAFDAWFDEDKQVYGRLRDPYHRVDTRQSSRHVRVRLGDRVLAESDRPVLLSETGLPNRWYLCRGTCGWISRQPGDGGLSPKGRRRLRLGAGLPRCGLALP